MQIPEAGAFVHNGGVAMATTAKIQYKFAYNGGKTKSVTISGVNPDWTNDSIKEPLANEKSQQVGVIKAVGNLIKTALQADMLVSAEYIKTENIGVEMDSF